MTSWGGEADMVGGGIWTPPLLAYIINMQTVLKDSMSGYYSNIINLCFWLKSKLLVIYFPGSTFP